MYKFIISTDNNCDFPEEHVKNNDLIYLKFSFTLDNVEYGGEGMPSMSPEEFYARMRNGSMPKTSQISPGEAFEAFEEYAKSGTPLLHICFSSKLSGTYNNFVFAAEELREKYPQSNIIILDSKSASLGQGCMVDYAIKLRNEGKTIEQTAALINENMQHFCQIATVNDLFHLQRGGRMSKVKAFAGSMLGIKPIIHMDSEGSLVPIAKTRGRKAALDFLVKAAVTQMIREQNDRFYVSHGDCFEEAEYVAEEIKRQTGIQDYILNMVGPVIGSHTGCGVVCVFFRGADRKPVF